MEKKSKRRRRFFIELVIVFVLIALGTVMIARVFAQYGQTLLKNQDEQLYHLAQAVDRNIDGLLEQCEANLNYVVNRGGFLEAERVWLDTGESDALLQRMRENLLTENELISVMLAEDENGIVLSTDGKTDYKFLERAGSGSLRYCMDPDGRLYLTFLCENETHVRYAALMDLNAFYMYIVSDELAEYDWVILTDISSEILVFHQQGRVQAEQLDAVSSATCGQEGVNILLDQQSRQMIGTTSYEYTDRDNGESYTARMVSIPTDMTKNDAFAIGVVTNFEDVLVPMNQAAVRLLCWGGVSAAGILLLLSIVVRFRQRSERDLAELEVLREKNEAMEALNKKIRELAHHQRLETIGTLTSGIAHEFNNLLTPIMGYSMLALEQIPEEDEDLYDNILEIYNASLRAKEIISRLSELSGKNSPSAFQKVSMEALVQKVLHVASPVLPPGVDVQTCVECPEICVTGNETHLSQMLLNLVLNAFYAMEENGGTLTVSVGKAGDKAVLRVKDTGRGIPEDVLPHIFEPFMTTRETGKGTGLGLPIVVQVVSEHHGEIFVDSKEGQGSTFTVELPMEKEGKTEETVLS